MVKNVTPHHLTVLFLAYAQITLGMERRSIITLERPPDGLGSGSGQQYASFDEVSVPVYASFGDEDPDHSDGSPRSGGHFLAAPILIRRGRHSSNDSHSSHRSNRSDSQYVQIDGVARFTSVCSDSPAGSPHTGSRFLAAPMLIRASRPGSDGSSRSSGSRHSSSLRSGSQDSSLEGYCGGKRHVSFSESERSDTSHRPLRSPQPSLAILETVQPPTPEARDTNLSEVRALLKALIEKRKEYYGNPHDVECDVECDVEYKEYKAFLELIRRAARSKLVVINRRRGGNADPSTKQSHISSARRIEAALIKIVSVVDKELTDEEPTEDVDYFRPDQPGPSPPRPSLPTPSTSHITLPQLRQSHHVSRRP